MDPFSQGALGAIASQNFASKKHLAVACLLGFLSGMAADMDIFISSDSDPLLFLEYHRQFTHSLIFIPVGGLICASVFYIFVQRRWHLSFKQVYLYCVSGYATHALLDSCTSYGTQLFWPFTNYRVSWSNISIVDPVFTLPLLVLIILAAVKKRPRYARWAAIWVCVCLGFGFVQKERAESAGMETALSRGHTPVRLEAKPGFANMLLWKVIYETDDQYHVVGVRTGIEKKIYPGESIGKLDVKNDFPWLDPDSQQAKDIERFRWFSDGFIAAHPDKPNRIMDVRYSMLPDEIEALWMVELSPDKNNQAHVDYAHEHRQQNPKFKKMWDMILDRP